MALKHKKALTGTDHGTSDTVSKNDWNDDHNWGVVQVTISNTNDSGTFTVTEADTSYYPIPFVVDYSANCPFLTFRVRRVSKTTSQFIVELSAPPGSGESITIGCVLARG